MWHRRVVSTLLSCALLFYSIHSAAQAAMVPTSGSVSPPPVEASAPELLQRLQALGLSPETARLRIARLTPAERAELKRSIDHLPAGGDTLGALAFVALILLLTDVLGITDVYPFVTRTVNDSKPGTARAGECPPVGTTSAQR